MMCHWLPPIHLMYCFFSSCIFCKHLIDECLTIHLYQLLPNVLSTSSSSQCWQTCIIVMQLSRIIYLFSRNMHDASLSLSIHTTCARLMLNLVNEKLYSLYTLLYSLLPYISLWILYCIVLFRQIHAMCSFGCRLRQFLRKVLTNIPWMRHGFYRYEFQSDYSVR